MNLKLGISPCPNDTFSFFHLLNGNFNREVSYNEHFHDIEKLNKGLLNAEFDVCKASFGIIPQISNNYQILDAGSALGFGCGPLLVARENFKLSEIATMKIPIHGHNTTAKRLLNLVIGQNRNTCLLYNSEPANEHKRVKHCARR